MINIEFFGFYRFIKTTSQTLGLWCIAPPRIDAIYASLCVSAIKTRKRKVFDKKLNDQAKS
jgi:hypothetical protein